MYIRRIKWSVKQHFICQLCVVCLKHVLSVRFLLQSYFDRHILVIIDVKLYKMTYLPVNSPTKVIYYLQ